MQKSIVKVTIKKLKKSKVLTNSQRHNKLKTYGKSR